MTVPATGSEEEEIAAVIGEEEVEAVRHLPAVVAHEAMVARGEISAEDVAQQRQKILDVQKLVMRDGVHFGIIPGVSKPSLYKPGAEVLCTTFRLAPAYERHTEWVPRPDGKTHLIVTSDCTLTHAQSGVVLGSAGGMCTSMESKYAYRKKGRTCPACGAEAIIKGKAQYGGGWVCWKNHKTTPGCGTKYDDGDAKIEEQVEGRVDNDDIADTYNTVLKMADKRALVAAILVCTAASEVFTQDVEDNASTAAAQAKTDTRDDSAAGGALTKMRLDIQDLLRNLDKKRKAEAGASFAEMAAVVAGKHETSWDELTEEQTVELGMSLGRYWAYVLDALAKKEPVSQYDVWFAQDDVPF